MSLTVKEYCAEIYTKTYIDETKRLTDIVLANPRIRKLSSSRSREIETAAQKEAIKISIISGLRTFKTVEAALIWRAVYETHVHRKSGVDDADTIANVISADQSWKKSSGHAFEEMVKMLGSSVLSDHGIEIVLQRDLSILIRAGELHNEPRDISWLREQASSDVFDLYAIVTRNGKRQCYGVIQSKTSIRDRVTRDREPSTQAMQSFFWSVAITLDGDFFRLPKFIHMVNGGSSDYQSNGWHGMYVFSELYTQARIYATDLDFKNFKEHAIEAAEYWLTQRQWFNPEWMAKVAPKTEPVLYHTQSYENNLKVATDTEKAYKRQQRNGGTICDKCKQEFHWNETGRENPGHKFKENVDCPYCGNTVCEITTSRDISVRKIED